jgi:hypothetical protein
MDTKMSVNKYIYFPFLTYKFKCSITVSLQNDSVTQNIIFINTQS